MGKLFGTNGVRGYANKDMDVELAMRLGRALGSFLKPGDVVAVGRDTRTSGPMLMAALAAGLASTGVHVHDAGIVTTPALQYRVKTSGGRFAAGAVITASHNPPEFNGIKFIDPDGTEMRSDKEDAIEALYFASNFRSAAWNEIGQTTPELGVNDAYVDAIVAKVDAAAIRRKKLTVVLDTSNGAGSLTAPILLRKLGVHVITMNAQIDGTFPGHPSEPTPENVKDLVLATKTFSADLGVVQDGDADRCVFVDEKGTYIDGNRTLALMAGYVVAQKKGGLVVTPVSSSGIVEEHVKAKGGRLEYTRVGAPVVARHMMDHKAIVGGEENGGIIWPELQHCRDASMTMAKVLELLATSAKPFSSLLAEVPTAASVKKKLECPNERKQKALDLYAAAHQKDRVDRTDGVKVYTSEGWVLVRPSGTEPIFRVYAEAKTPDVAEALASKNLAEIRDIIARAG
ncbi:MAG TPA: phosphoglucosamine mutase [Candidatus Thermoplasmatota archaeon]|nr:phosphoglucosamine mutase [Candidatus Thermoplasmatota archaeon]